MKKIVAFSLALGAVTSMLPNPAQTQQSMPDMPGMSMKKPQARAAKPTPKPTPKSNSAQPSHAVPVPNRTSEPQDPMPADMQGMGRDAGNAKASAAARSESQSVQQQAGQMTGRPPTKSDAGSITVPTMELQEPEAVELHTGSDLPAPELLREVVSREPMTLGAFLSAAEQTNPTLAQAQRNVDRSRDQARQVSLPPDPVVGYSAEHIRGGEYRGGEQGAFFSQEIVLGRKLALRRDVLRAEGEANALALEVQRARVHNDVAHAFFDTLTAQQSVVLQDRLLKVAQDAAENSHEMERIGQMDASDVLNAEIAAEQAKLDFEQAQRMFLSAFARLKSNAGLATLEPHPLEGSLVEPPQLDAQAAVEHDVEASPAVRQAQADVSVADARVRSARREKIPDLNLKAGEWHSGEPLSNNGQQAGWMSFAEAGVQLPLWNRNQGNTAAAQAELARAQKEVSRTQLWTRSRAEPEAQGYLTARFAAERLRGEMLPRARRAYQLEVTKYQEMAQSYPHVLAAQRTLFALQLAYVHALNDEWDHALALENYTLMNALEPAASEGDDATSMNRPTDATSR